MNKCTWAEQFDGTWKASCYEVPHTLAEEGETPESIGFVYCPFCGKEIDQYEFSFTGEEE